MSLDGWKTSPTAGQFVSAAKVASYESQRGPDVSGCEVILVSASDTAYLGPRADGVPLTSGSVSGAFRLPAGEIATLPGLVNPNQVEFCANGGGGATVVSFYCKRVPPG